MPPNKTLYQLASCTRRSSAREKLLMAFRVEWGRPCVCSSSGGDQAARAAGRCSFPESAPRATSTSSRSDLPRHRFQIWSSSAEKQRGAAAAVGLGKADRASFVSTSTHCPLSFLLSSRPSFRSQQAGKQNLAFFNAMRFFCLKKAQAKQELVFLNTIFLSKRNMGVVVVGT